MCFIFADFIIVYRVFNEGLIGCVSPIFLICAKLMWHTSIGVFKYKCLHHFFFFLNSIVEGKKNLNLDSSLKRDQLYYSSEHR